MRAARSRRRARLALYADFGERYKRERVAQAADEYCKLAQSRGLTVTEMALAFVRTRWFVASTIVGATDLAQLKQNIDSVKVELDAETPGRHRRHPPALSQPLGLSAGQSMAAAQEPGQDAMSAAPALPLSGVRVVEFVHMIMGPSCGLVLADLGAEVIKIEPLAGDNTRRLSGTGAGFWVTYNRNKKSLAVDLKSPEGIEVVKKLLATAGRGDGKFPPRHHGQARPGLRGRERSCGPKSSTVRSRASCPARTSSARRWTKWCR